MQGRRPLLQGLFGVGVGVLAGAASWRALAQAATPAGVSPGSAPAPGKATRPAGASARTRVLAPRTLRFPHDHGAHPDLHTEWWYLTGELAAGERRFGFQVTFFRSRVDATHHMASAFAARQLLFAHAAVTDLASGRLLHDQRIAREGFGIARAREDDTDLRIRDWTMARQADGRYTARVDGGDFTLDLMAMPTQPILLQGQDGLSRKGPQAAQASYYYSQPHLRVEGRLRLSASATAAGQDKTRVFDTAVKGRAWLDHEWSEALLHPEAVGWDWVGMNLQGGSALTVFRLRRADGSTLWAGGSWRASGGAVRTFTPDDLRMSPGRTWTSPLTGTAYPVAWTLQTPAGRFTVEALADAQELDSRRSTGTVYWEGLSALRDEAGREVGRGYLELTGYGRRLTL